VKHLIAAGKVAASNGVIAITFPLHDRTIPKKPQENKPHDI
jgi:hypothetical protein